MGYVVECVSLWDMGYGICRVSPSGIWDMEGSLSLSLSLGYGIWDMKSLCLYLSLGYGIWVRGGSFLIPGWGRKFFGKTPF